jgi:hypothetical protein
MHSLISPTYGVALRLAALSQSRWNSWREILGATALGGTRLLAVGLDRSRRALTARVGPRRLAAGLRWPRGLAAGLDGNRRASTARGGLERTSLDRGGHRRLTVGMSVHQRLAACIDGLLRASTSRGGSLRASTARGGPRRYFNITKVDINFSCKKLTCDIYP